MIRRTEGMAQSFHFPPFQVDVAREQLRRGKRAIALRPKTWAVLRYLVEHPGRLVKKQELLDAVWPETAISEATLTTSIHELRQVLGDRPRRSRYLETVPRRGFRFVAALSFSRRYAAGSLKDWKPVT